MRGPCQTRTPGFSGHCIETPYCSRRTWGGSAPLPAETPSPSRDQRGHRCEKKEEQKQAGQKEEQKQQQEQQQAKEQEKKEQVAQEEKPVDRSEAERLLDALRAGEKNLQVWRFAKDKRKEARRSDAEKDW